MLISGQQRKVLQDWLVLGDGSVWVSTGWYLGDTGSVHNLLLFGINVLRFIDIAGDLVSLPMYFFQQMLSHSVHNLTINEQNIFVTDRQKNPNQGRGQILLYRNCIYYQQ